MTANGAFLRDRPLNPARYRGATLIEVLIAVVILSIGLLGYAAMQSTSLQAAHSAQLRSHATWLGHDIADRLRACKAEGGNGAMVAGCRTVEIAGWQTLVAGALPAGSGTVQVGTAFTRIVPEFGENRTLVFIPLDITIEWDDGRGAGDAPGVNEQQWTFTTEI